MSKEVVRRCQLCGRVEHLASCQLPCQGNTIAVPTYSRVDTRKSLTRLCDQVLAHVAPVDVLDYLVSFLVLPSVPPHPGTIDPFSTLQKSHDANYFVVLPDHFRIDVLDTSHHWLSALVIEREQRTVGVWWVHICFNYWGLYWSEWLPWDTQIIQPVGTFACLQTHRTTYRGARHAYRFNSCDRHFVDMD